MKEKKFFYVVMVGLCVLLFMIGSLNYWIDYYGVFRAAKEGTVEASLINERFVKMDYLFRDKNYQNYNSYLFGSSRVMKMDPQLSGSDKKTYNLGASIGLPEDCFRQLQVLLQNGAIIKVVYLGLDNESYLRNYLSDSKIDYHTEYRLTLFGNITYYSNLLFNANNIKLFIKENILMIDRFNGSGPKGHYALDKGIFLVPDSLEQRIERNTDSYVRQEKFGVPMLTIGLSKNEIQENFIQCVDCIWRIHDLCKRNGIQLVLFFNPQHMTTYLADDMELMNRFKKELVKISPFWDFSGVNYVTANNYFWYETSHPRAFICDKILDTVSGQNKITWVPDFGVYVTPENVDAFCEKAVRDREAYDPDHEQWVPSEEERKIMTRRVNYPW